MNIRYPLYLIVGCFSAMASAQLSHQGLLAQELFSPPSQADTCIISTTEMEFTYTQLSARLFHSTQNTPLPAMTQTLQVTCSAPISYLSLEVASDNQADSVIGNDPSHFGLGRVNNQGSLGYYQVKLDEAKVGDDSVYLYRAKDEASMGTLYPSIFLLSGEYHGWAKESALPASGQRFSVNMTVLPTLSSLKETKGPLTEGANLHGELVLRFPFGI